MDIEQTPKAFMSYTRFDDQNDGGRLTRFRELLSKEVRAQTGREFLIFQDIEDIEWGQDFKRRIEDVIKEVAFLIPIITPNFFSSEYCREELRQFLKREEQLQRNDLILPVYYIACPILEDRSKQATDELAQIIAARQHVDWRNLRFASFNSQKVRSKLADMAVQIRAAMERVQPSLALDSPVSTKGGVLEGLSPSIPPYSWVIEKIKSVPVSEIVDFEAELELFRSMLADPSERCLMFIRAPGGRGKTCLLRLMRHYCEKQGVPSCRVDFRIESYDSPHLTLAHQICQELQLSPRHLAKALWPLSAHAFGAQDVSVRVEGDVTGSNIIIAGGDVYQCEQVVIHFSSTDQSLRQPYVKDRLKQAFDADLGELAAAKGRVVCFFDSLEDISDEEEGWLLEALLCPTAEGKLKDVIVVIAGRRWPPELEEWDWEHHAHMVPTLPLMSKQQVKEFANRVGYEITETEVEFCWRACQGGKPLYMGIVVKNLRATMGVRP